jgi:hypothetical protein
MLEAYVRALMRAREDGADESYLDAERFARTLVLTAEARSHQKVGTPARNVSEPLIG